MTAGACAPSDGSDSHVVVLLSPPSVFVCSCRFSFFLGLSCTLCLFLFLCGPLACVAGPLSLSLSLSLSVVCVVARGLFCICCRSVPWVTLYPISRSPLFFGSSPSSVRHVRPRISFVSFGFVPSPCSGLTGLAIAMWVFWRDCWLFSVSNVPSRVSFLFPFLVGVTTLVG